MHFWQYVLQPTDTLGPVAVFAIFLSIFAIIGGSALIGLPKELALFYVTHLAKDTVRDRKEAGRNERGLRAELRVKIGTAMIVWCSALILALLLRLLGTPGLTTRLLPVLVVLPLPFLVGYIGVYRLFLYPRYRAVCRIRDTNSKYDATAKKASKKASGKVPEKTKVRHRNVRIKEVSPVRW